MIILGVATGAVGVAGAGALATGKLTLGQSHAQAAPVALAASADTSSAVPLAAYAEVLSVTPVSQTVTKPRQQCHKEKVTVHTKPKDSHNIAGTAVGAAVGGIVFNQLGGGVFRALATTAGVIGGGYAGNRIENSVHKGSTKTVTKERCVTAYDRTTIPNGYLVSYTINGKTQQVHMDHDPGRQIPLKDGQLDLNAYNPDRSDPQGQSPDQGPNPAPAPLNGGLGPTGSQDPSANQAPRQGGRPG